MVDAVTKPKTKVKTKVERPRLHKVILVNDDYTPREFVVTVLKAEFRMTEDQAHKVMITAHRRGVCVVAVFTRDVAEVEGVVIELARTGSQIIQRQPGFKSLTHGIILERAPLERIVVVAAEQPAGLDHR